MNWSLPLRKKVVSKLLGMTDVSVLVSTIKEAELHENKEMVMRFPESVFTLRD